jgi:phage terminase large subunit
MKSLEGIDYFWNEEAQSTTQEALDIAIPTFRRKPGSRMIFTWNPDQPDDAVDHYFRGQTPPPRTYAKFVTHEDNPYFLWSELPAEMDHAKAINHPRFANIWLGEYNLNADAKIFKNTRVGRVKVPDHIEPRFGLDFGFSVSPNALTKSYYIPEQKLLYIAQEAFGKVSLNDMEEFVEAVTETRSYSITADSARPESIELLNSMGFSVYGSRKGPGSVKAGITFLQGLDIVIDPECVNMQEEARKYFWKTDRNGKVLPIPFPDFDHGWDSVRYSLEDVISGNARACKDDDDGIFKMRIGARR